MSAAISITGAGAVSPAGWGMGALLDALLHPRRIESSHIVRPLGALEISSPVLRVPMEGTAVPKAARLRRSSPISKFAASAAIEALGEIRLKRITEENLRVGVIFTLLNGCVNYSNRFFGEVLANPQTASPILFPETVFNAPSSHLSAMLGSHAPNDTLIGDSSGFFTGIDLAIEWLERDEVDACLVVCSEELDWLSAEGLRLYSKHFVPSEGAAAICLEKGDESVRIERLPDPISYAFHSRRQAALALREKLAVSNDGHTCLIDGCCGVTRFDAAETAAWQDWQGPRYSPRLLLGESMGAATGLQCVAAVALLNAGIHEKAIITSGGGNQQAAGISIRRSL